MPFCYVTIPEKNRLCQLWDLLKKKKKKRRAESNPLTRALKLLLCSPAVTSKHCCAAVCVCVYVRLRVGVLSLSSLFVICTAITVKRSLAMKSLILVFPPTTLVQNVKEHHK